MYISLLTVAIPVNYTSELRKFLKLLRTNRQSLTLKSTAFCPQTIQGVYK
jgi:hypothetical protein